MLKYYKSKIEALEDDSEFNYMIDSIAEEAYNDGELWLDEIDDE